MRCIVWLTGALLAAGLHAADQGRIVGIIQDVTGRPLSGASVQVQSDSLGAKWRVDSKEDGFYSVSGIPAGKYKVTVRFPGFRTVSRVGIVLNSDNDAAIDFVMELLTLHEIVTVVSGRDNLDPSAGGSLILTRGTPGATLPNNGPDYRTFFDLMPGVVITPAGVNDGGQFTSNGQRPNANAFFVDGVSANTGVGGSTLPGSFPGASLPGMTASGSTENLGTPEGTQSVELLTSTFAPEFGGRPGAEAFVTTRSGSGAFHGELFGNARDQSWNARDWFANSYGLPYPRPSYGDYGAVLGGPIQRNRTFFFFSAEHSQLSDGGLQLTTVPSLSERNSAPASLQGILAFFPLPTGPNLTSDEAEGLLPLERSATLGTYSARVDHVLGTWGTMFGRYVRSTSSSSSSQVETIQGVSDWQSVTVGVTGRSGSVIQEVRLNYSRADFVATFNPTLGMPFPLAGLWGPSDAFPDPSWNSSNSAWGISVPGLGQFVLSDAGKNRQGQWDVRDGLSRTAGRHQLRAGLEYLTQRPSRDYPLTSVLVQVPSLESLMNQGPLTVTYSQLPQYGSRLQVGSFFAQDTTQITGNLTAVYGFRWELTPPSGSQPGIPTTSGLWTPASAWTTIQTGNVNGTAPWPMRYAQIEPRLGLAYRLPKIGMILRAGVGLFYDTMLAASINPVNGAPFNSWLLSGGATTINTPPATSSDTQPGQPAEPDILRFLSGSYPALRLPASTQWRIALERSFSSRAVGSLTYFGSSDSHLIGNETYLDPASDVLERTVTLTQNSSAYGALQMRLHGSLRPDVDVSSSYTWSHCIDDGSEDSSVFLIHPGYQLSEVRASCDFDSRQALTASISYHMPNISPLRPRDLFSGWAISGILRSRTGFPITVLGSQQVLGQDVTNADRPDLRPGVPIWISDPTAAGGRRLNAAAFFLPPAGAQGNLGRNAVYGNSMTQLDVALRRTFELFHGTSLEATVSVFNVLNHPEFADPVPFLSSPLFGQSTSMQNLMLGSGTPNTGLPPLFQTGGSRSAQLSLRFSF